MRWITKQEIIRKVNAEGTPLGSGTFMTYNRRRLLPEKHSAATEDGKLTYLYPERTCLIVKELRSRKGNLNYIASRLWVDIALADFPEDWIQAARVRLNDIAICNAEKRNRAILILRNGMKVIRAFKEIIDEHLDFYDRIWDAILVACGD